MQVANVDNRLLDIFNELNDDPSDAQKFLDILKRILRTPSNPPLPIVEFITIIKNEKPILYNNVRMRLYLSDNIRMLFELEVDYEQAKQRLNWG